MTPEQAVAWLILEGWRCVLDLAAEGAEGKWRLRWFPPTDDSIICPRVKQETGKVGQGTWWRRSEFKRYPDICPSEYPQYAVEVVDMILSGATKS